MRTLLRPALFAARRRAVVPPPIIAPTQAQHLPQGGTFRITGFGSVRSSVIRAPGPPDPSRPQPAYEVIAPGPDSSSGASSSSTGATTGSGSGNASSSKSQHPFAEIESDIEGDAGIEAESGSGPGSSSGTSTSNTDFILSPSSVGSSSNLPSPPTGPLTTSSPAPPGPPHPFDTHAFVAYLESHSLPLETSRTLMEGTRSMIVSRSARARGRMLGKEEMENAAYLFRAALGELRTELNVRARSDGLALRGEAAGIRREVEGLEVKMKEDVQTLRHDTEIETNNRKEETRTEMKGFEIQIEEINNKFTISLGDLRTEIESAKWDATRRAISIIVLIVVSAVAVSLFTSEPPKPAAAPGPISSSGSASASSSQMRDMGVGSDTVSGSGSGLGSGGAYAGDDEMLEDGQGVGISISDERLEKLLREKGVGEIAIAREQRQQQQQQQQQLASKGRSKRRGSRSGEGEVFVDRI